MTSNFCIRDENGNYIDPITHEIIKNDRLVKFKENNILYCFDYLTLQKYKKTSGSYLNPFNRNLLPESVVDKIKEIRRQFLVIVNIYYYDILSNTENMEKFSLDDDEVSKINTLSSLLDFIKSKLSDVFIQEDLIVSNIKLFVENEKINIYRSENIQLKKENKIYIYPPKSPKRFFNRIKIFESKLTGLYLMGVKDVRKFLEKINSHSNKLKLLISEVRLHAIDFIGEKNTLLTYLSDYGMKIFYVLTYNNYEILDFAILRQLSSSVSWFIDMLHYGLKIEITKNILNSKLMGLKINLFNNAVYVQKIYDILVNEPKLINDEILEAMFIFLNSTNISQNGLVRHFILDKEEFAKFLIKNNKYYYIIQFSSIPSKTKSILTKYL